MTNTDQANKYLGLAEKEMGVHKALPTARAAVYASMAFVCVAVDVAGALRGQAKAQDRIANVINQGRSWS